MWDKKPDDSWGTEKSSDTGWGGASSGWGTEKSEDSGWGGGSSDKGNSKSDDSGWGGGNSKSDDSGWGGGNSDRGNRRFDGSGRGGRGSGRGRGGGRSDGSSWGGGNSGRGGGYSGRGGGGGGRSEGSGWGGGNSGRGGGGSSDSGWGGGNSAGGNSKSDDSGWGGGNSGGGNTNSDDSGWGGGNSDKGNTKSNDSGWGETSSGWGNEKSGDSGWGDGNSGKNNGKSEDSGWGGGNSGFKRPRDSGEADSGDFSEKRQRSGDDAERPAPYKPAELDLDEEARLQGDGAGVNFAKYHDQKVTCIPKDKITPVETFEEIVKSELLLKNIKSQKYTEMTPIQKWAMPIVKGGFDLIGCAQTGSGKTAAFLLPILQDLITTQLESHDPDSDCQNPYCLIISPTRELANQIHVHANMLSKDSIIKCHVIYGQISTFHLKSKLSTGCHVLVATPGRLKDFVQRGWIGFKNIKYVILDEGDRLVDEGFTADIGGFFSHESMPPTSLRQTLFFSATFKKETQVKAREYLKDDFIFITVGRIGAANEDIKQEFLRVERTEKKRELRKILDGVPEEDKTIVFTQTKTAADMLAGFFTSLKLSSTSIHGDRHQSQREEAIRSFRKGEKRFLISSPVGNRGLDLPKVALVINYDLPNNIDEYVHRIGRTGRAGHIGRAISFYDETRDSEIIPELIEILTEAKQEIPDWMTGSTNNGSGPAGTGDGDDWGVTSEPAAAASADNDDWGVTTATNPTSDVKGEENSEGAAKLEVEDDGW